MGSTEIPRVLPQAPPTRPLALLVLQQVTVMSRLTCVAARVWKCGTGVRTHSFILHLMTVLCVVKSGGDFHNEELEHISFVLCHKCSAEPSLHLFYYFLFLSTLQVGQCQRVGCGSHDHGLFASPPQPHSLIRLHRGGNNICAYKCVGVGGGGFKPYSWFCN